MSSNPKSGYILRVHSDAHCTILLLISIVPLRRFNFDKHPKKNYFISTKRNENTCLNISVRAFLVEAKKSENED
jgi:hypothetical protein